MIFTNKKIIETINILDSFSTKRLPQKISYAIVKNIIMLKKEYEIINMELEKIFNNYKEYLKYDNDGNVVRNRNGIPIIDNQIEKEKMYGQLNELLNIEIEISMFTIDETCFDYENKDMYDILTPQEMFMLIDIICNKTKE